MSSSLPDRGRLPAAVAVAAAAALPLFAPPARADTFEGACTGAPAVVEWPEGLRALPAPIVMTAEVDGGRCDGTVNGERVDGAPLRLSWEIRGPQSCPAGYAEGRTSFSIAHGSFTGSVHYRRGGITPTIVIEADGGGYAESVARALFVPEDAVACAGYGIARKDVVVETFSTLTPIRSAEHRGRSLHSPAEREQPRRPRWESERSTSRARSRGSSWRPATPAPPRSSTAACSAGTSTTSRSATAAPTRCSAWAAPRWAR
ncbi:MAG TPA: hypothetical protein VF520_15685 [Thermoleophilaceae bacterium]|jgi:hypothetical protein